MTAALEGVALAVVLFPAMAAVFTFLAGTRRPTPGDWS